MQTTFDAIAAAFGLEPVLADARGLDVLAARALLLPRWAATMVLALSWSFLALEILAPALLLLGHARGGPASCSSRSCRSGSACSPGRPSSCASRSPGRAARANVGRNLALVLALEVSLSVLFAAAGVAR